MKPSKYMLSVQWGSGHHYFLGNTHDRQYKALTARKMHQDRLNKEREGKRGAKPTVYLWEQQV